VISDNRFGLYTDAVPCIFITHQLTIRVPFGWLEKKLQQVNYRYINRFTACWVPDAPEEPSLAGILSHPGVNPSAKLMYIGLLSRMQYEAAPKQYDYCILLSGPEPQRSILEEKICRSIASITGNILLVRGLPGQESELLLPPHVTVRNHLGTEAIQQAIRQSEYIICRSGYTTLMELVTLRKKAILVPTPGQTEQEYLAERLFRSGTFYMVQQQMFSVEKDLAAASAFPYKHLAIPVFEAGEVGRLLSDVMTTFVAQ
jgi:predicted glycosyltransferase